MINEIDKVLPDYFDYEIIADAATTRIFEVNHYLGAAPEGECVGEGKLVYSKASSAKSIHEDMPAFLERLTNLIQ